jgi:hypothetical protein
MIKQMHYVMEKQRRYHLLTSRLGSVAVSAQLKSFILGVRARRPHP